MAPSREASLILVPEGTRVLHIGPPKTGTTAVQSALHAGRPMLAQHGVRLAGPTRHPASNVHAATGRRSPGPGETPPRRKWLDLVREARRAKEPRVIISSEFFADARPDAIERIVDDIGRDQVHIVATLRPLARIIPSQWQQYVQSGIRVGFDDWLDRMFNKPETKLTPSFWYRHRHDRLVARWADVVGPDRMTVVALDESDRGMVLRVFERLLGLPEGVLVAERDLDNRSMTLAEIEVIRAFNVKFKAEGLDMPLHAQVMNFGAASYMKAREPGPDEPRVETPAWAVARISEVAREMADAIAASGVGVVGNLDHLVDVADQGRPDGDDPVVVITPELAASAAMGVLISGGLARGRTDGGDGGDGDDADDDAARASRAIRRPAREPLYLVRIPTIQLLGVVLRRAVANAKGRAADVRARFR